MPSSERKQTQKDDARKDSAEQEVNRDVVEEGAALKDDIDSLLDEIDELLEEDSEEFVENYIQRGGE
ncbi:MAG: ubiquitin-like protein Pup [Candidatus Poribacteria bacterium]|nr:ubiquitin-like protein Pup [Candidatus Poribacteria bacterium]